MTGEGAELAYSAEHAKSASMPVNCVCVPSLARQLTCRFLLLPLTPRNPSGIVLCASTASILVDSRKPTTPLMIQASKRNRQPPVTTRNHSAISRQGEPGDYVGGGTLNTLEVGRAVGVPSYPHGKTRPQVALPPPESRRIHPAQSGAIALAPQSCRQLRLASSERRERAVCRASTRDGQSWQQLPRSQAQGSPARERRVTWPSQGKVTLPSQNPA